jgi:hypothetical protein
VLKLIVEGMHTANSANLYIAVSVWPADEAIQFPRLLSLKIVTDGISLILPILEMGR